MTTTIVHDPLTDINSNSPNLVEVDLSNGWTPEKVREHAERVAIQQARYLVWQQADPTRSQETRFDEPMARRYLELIMDRTPVNGDEVAYEFRVIGTGWNDLKPPEPGLGLNGKPRRPQTKCGLFNDLQKALWMLARVEGTNPYVCVNPISLTRFRAEHGDTDLATKLNQMHVVKKGEGVADHHVACIRWLYLDFDAIRPVVDDVKLNSTDAEQRPTIEARDQIIAAYPELAPGIVAGTSGNGSFMLVRLHDQPNDHTTAGVGVDRDSGPTASLILRSMKLLGRKFGSESAEVDFKTRNPGRIGPVCGLLKSKAPHSEDRPRRIASLDSPEAGSDRVPVPVDLAAWFKNHDDGVRDSAKPASKSTKTNRPAGSYTGGTGRGSMVYTKPALFYSRIAGMFNRIGTAVSHQKGHGKTLDAACVLVKGFDMTPDEAWPYMQFYNSSYCTPQWDDHDLYRKLTQADARYDNRPRGYLIDCDLEFTDEFGEVFRADLPAPAAGTEVGA